MLAAAFLLAAAASALRPPPTAAVDTRVCVLLPPDEDADALVARYAARFFGGDAAGLGAHPNVSRALAEAASLPPEAYEGARVNFKVPGYGSLVRFFPGVPVACALDLFEAQADRRVPAALRAQIAASGRARVHDDLVADYQRWLAWQEARPAVRADDGEVTPLCPSVFPSTGYCAPLLVLIGSPRCGTTFLHGLFAELVAQFVPAREKETHAFLGDSPAGAFPRITPDDSLYTADFTPIYMYQPPGLQAVLPATARLVVVLRDPTRRAESMYKFAGRDGMPDPWGGLSLDRVATLEMKVLAGCFADGLDVFACHAERFPPTMPPDMTLVRAGIYHRFLEPYAGTGRLTPVCAEALFADPVAELDRLLAALGLPSSGAAPAAAAKIAHHAVHVPNRKPASEPVRAALDDFYRPFNDDLATLLPAMAACTSGWGRSRPHTEL